MSDDKRPAETHMGQPEARTAHAGDLPLGELLPAHGRLADITLSESIPAEADLAIVGIMDSDAGAPTPSFPATGSFSREAQDALSAELARQCVKPEPEATRLVTAAGFPHPVLAVGLGAPSELTGARLREAAGSAARALPEQHRHVVCHLGHLGMRETVEGLLLGSYRYRGLRSDAAAAPPTITVISDAGERSAVDAGRIAAQATAFTRDLVNTPANLLSPAGYASILDAIADTVGVAATILDEEELDRQGFGGILAVGGGSAHPPRLVHLDYRPEGARSTVALVGKGITFDTGGISLKPAAGMEIMVSDMGGSAAAAATVFAAARLGLPLRVTATLPLAENMPSGAATRPGDVIRHYGGITSEVINTDAEGRLVLADAIVRACEDRPDYLLETATLTGAQITALGARTAGVMGSDDLRDEVARLGTEVGEPAWPMPFLREHEKEMESRVADLRNVGPNRDGGMLYAAAYLSRFVPEGIPWAHIDVAGPSWNERAPHGFTPERATGVPTRTLLGVLESLADQPTE